MQRRSWALVALAACCAACCVWLGWEYVGTTWLAHRYQSEASAQLRQAWTHHVATAQGRGAVRVFATVRIPRFGESYAVPVVEGTSPTALSLGFGHFVGTASPGGLGNFAVTAHRVTHGEPLARMQTLRPGDVIEVETYDAVWTYRLDTAGNQLTVTDGAAWVVRPFPVNPALGPEPPGTSRRLITLITCAGLFHTDRRLVAFGHLARQTHLDRAAATSVRRMSDDEGTHR